ncbi:hypothetical protein MNBD_PLANCTO03-2110 [hydrothermal vent metagenome]|uniref:Thioester domain-containing protein n=1 Tax=hydrothermal vent metagenome TaxID=652676 RepID=A0A3B1DV53_9ZZZZ
MKRMRIAAAVVAAAGVASLSTAADTVVYSDGPGDVSGGSFSAVTGDNGSFMTFCLEYNENLDIKGGTVYEYDVSTYATFNGQGLGFQDPLDSRTAFIYQNFRDGEIRNILGDQSLTDTQLANAIQIAIWEVEQENVDWSFHADYANAQALIAAAQDAINNQQWSGLGNVRVMNVWAQGQSGTVDGARQDTLIIVPLPTTAGLAGLGLLGLTSIRRRR